MTARNETDADRAVAHANRVLREVFGDEEPDARRAARTVWNAGFGTADDSYETETQS